MVNDGEFARDMSFSTLSGKQSNRTSPKTFQATNQQLRDVQRFCSTETPVGLRSILGIDGAHNCGEFYITLTTYHHPFIENKATGRPLLMIGPSVTHTTKTDEDYQCFLEQLDTQSQLIKKKELILAGVGTDGEAAIEKSVISRDIFQLVQQQNRVVERTYLALGDYQLKQEFQHHGSTRVAAVDIAGPHESNIKGMIEDGHKINKTMNGVVPYPGDVTGSRWFVCSPPIASSSTAPDVACQTKVFKIEKTKTVADKLNMLETVVNSFEASSKELPDPFHLIEKKLAPQAGAESSSLEIRKNEAAITLLDLKTATPKSSSKRDVPARIAFTLTHLGLVRGYSCYGCGSHIRAPPIVPEPPYDYCIVFYEKREWQKAGRPPCISPKCVYTYYHFDANCVKRKHPSFKGSDLLVPPEIVPCLLQCHRDLLKVQFGQ
eukprot:gene8555-9468_t